MVTKEVYQDLLISKLIEKWHRADWLSRNVFIQQDGAKPHISENDKVFKDALMDKGINTKLYMQAANSPDINLLHLGFLEPSRVSTVHHQKMKRNW